MANLHLQLLWFFKWLHEHSKLSHFSAIIMHESRHRICKKVHTHSDAVKWQMCSLAQSGAPSGDWPPWRWALLRTTIGRGWRWGPKQVCVFIPPQKYIDLFKYKREVKKGRYFVWVYLNDSLDHDLFVKMQRTGAPSVPRASPAGLY